jgi:glycosyltransferase involved in cell wall biosynthesis
VRVAYLVHQFLPHHTGGTELLTVGLARRAKANGNDVLVVSMSGAPGMELRRDTFHDRTWEGIPVREFGGASVPPTEPWLAEYDDLRTAALVAAEMERFRPDVVHVTHLIGSTIAVLPKLRRLGAVTLVTLTDYWSLCHRHTLTLPGGGLCERGPEDGMPCLKCAGISLPDPESADSLAAHRSGRAVDAVRSRWARIRKALEGVDIVMTLTAFQTDRLKRSGWEGAMTQLHHGPQEEPLLEARRKRAARLSEPDGRIRLLFAGTFIPQKGVHMILEAMARCDRADIGLTVIGVEGGDAAYRDRIRTAAGRDARITLRKPVPPEEFTNVLAEHDTLLVPYLWYENGPLIPKSAIRVGLPVATHDLGSLAEEFEVPEQGWLIAPPAVDSWKRWLDGLTLGAARRIVGVRDGFPTARAFETRCLELYESLRSSMQDN